MCIGGVIARNYVSCEEKQTLKGIQILLEKIMNMENATHFEVKG